MRCFFIQLAHTLAYLALILVIMTALFLVFVVGAMSLIYHFWGDTVWVIYSIVLAATLTVIGMQIFESEGC